jgi:hypothetical protein
VLKQYIKQTDLDWPSLDETLISEQLGQEVRNLMTEKELASALEEINMAYRIVEQKCDWGL